MSDQPVSKKLEYALIAWLWTHGGLLAPALLEEPFAQVLDSPDFFTPNPAGTGTDMDGLTYYPGHGAVDMVALPRCIVTSSEGGGGLADSGIDQCRVEVLLLSRSDDDVRHGLLHLALRALLQFGQLGAIQAVTNKPDGEDARAIQGFGLDALDFINEVEGRDEKKNQHGVRINFNVWAHLEAT